MEKCYYHFIIKWGTYKKNVVEKSLVLEKTKNHKIYPYLLDGVSEIISYSIKNDLSQTEMISTIDEFLKGIINKSNEINKS